MEIKRYRFNELKKARELQKEAIKLHLPCPPVVWWEAKILDKNGELKEHIQSKCNSYVRNGLNLIATAGMCLEPTVRSNTVYGNGVMSYKNTSDAFITSGSGYWWGNFSTPQIILGIGDSAETIDSVSLDAAISTGWSIGNPVQITKFEGGKLQNKVSRTFLNQSGENVSLNESGLTVTIATLGTTATGKNAMIIRDLFSTPLLVENGGLMVFEYNFELLYSV